MKVKIQEVNRIRIRKRHIYNQKRENISYEIKSKYIFATYFLKTTSANTTADL